LIGAKSVDAFYEQLSLRAATIDELLSDAFEQLPAKQGDPVLADRRLAAWCQSSASGDRVLFEKRLERDGLSAAQVLQSLRAVRRNTAASPPPWITDATWIDAALQRPNDNQNFPGIAEAEPCAFEQLLAPVVAEADRQVWSDLDARISANLNESARGSLRHALLRSLSELAAPAFYERFAKARGVGYAHFVSDMKTGGLRRLFEDKPVLLRLIAVLTRQWIDASREFAVRLEADLAAIGRDLLHSAAGTRAIKIEGGLSDPHNSGRSVLIVSFESGARVVYKPKDLRLDVAWRALAERLNRSNPPLELKAARAIARNGYGWTEFIAHSGCASQEGCERFFRRAGAWLALFHCFVTTDMHQENMIAAGEHPVPIDLETILQASAEEHKAKDPTSAAFDAANEIIGNSVMMVGLLPAYGRSAFNNVFAMGGMTADWNSRTVVKWNDINSDAMRPAKAKEVGQSNPNLPHVDGRYAKLAEHVDSFVAGFEDYAIFLSRWRNSKSDSLFEGFAGLPVRRVLRPTRFYYMLLQRLKNHRTMDDGVLWSAQADFVARLAEWERDSDPLWPLLRAERNALTTLNVPHFVVPSDGDTISDVNGSAARTGAEPGLPRALARFKSFDAKEIAWQVEVIRENARSAAGVVAAPASKGAPADIPPSQKPLGPAKDIFLAEAGHIAGELEHYAIRRGPGAAWIGLDWLGDAEVFQLVCLGPDLYNGASGIALFLGAHAAVTRSEPSRDLALAALSHLRRNLRGNHAARMARALGIGGALGMGSIVYALAVAAKCLHSDDLLADALRAAELCTDALIGADRHLDVMGGSAGAILGLLRLYRDTGSSAVLGRASKCGDHLLAQNRVGSAGYRTWIGQGSGERGLNGMSHGAAGFAYALASLAAATSREDFARAAAECMAFEDASYDAPHRNWPDLRASEPHWLCQWCHGAPGIGLARLATAKTQKLDAQTVATDIRRAVEGVEQGHPTPLDTLCCGTLGGIEFFCEAGATLKRGDLRELAVQRLLEVVERAAAAGDYRWNSGKRQFNLGLFRGLAGLGYTLLRRVDASLPNVLIWE
jgi:class II lanthipeptide synthase